MKPGWLVIALAVTAAPSLTAQRRERGGGRAEVLPNVVYDGRFTFARIRYSTPAELGGFGGGWNSPWSHDYPRAERHFTKILSELSTLQVRTDASNVLTLDDPELFKYPIAYLCEPGFWLPSEAEIGGLRAYLEKGGFLIVDDFEGSHWYNFEEQMRRVLPQGRLVQLSSDHPIFDSFYRVQSLDYVHPYFGTPSTFHGIFEDNDPTRRLMVIVNYNNDIAEYWEFSDTGLFPLDLSNEAYKLGVNYIVYALTR
jgi:hypothetical protein